MKVATAVVLTATLFLGACATQGPTTSSSMGSRIRALEDERDILYTMYTYAHALDYNLEDEWRNIWTQDASLFWADEPGIEAIMDVFRRHPHAPDTYWKHMLIEPRIHLNGDSATAESYLSRFINSPDGPVVASFGRYRDVFVRGDDGKWRFKERKVDRESCIKQCSGFPGHSFPTRPKSP